MPEGSFEIHISIPGNSYYPADPPVGGVSEILDAFLQFFTPLESLERSPMLGAPLHLLTRKFLQASNACPNPLRPHRPTALTALHPPPRTAPTASTVLTGLRPHRPHRPHRLHPHPARLHSLLYIESSYMCPNPLRLTAYTPTPDRKFLQASNACPNPLRPHRPHRLHPHPARPLLPPL